MPKIGSAKVSFSFGPPYLGFNLNSPSQHFPKLPFDCSMNLAGAVPQASVVLRDRKFMRKELLPQATFNHTTDGRIGGAAPAQVAWIRYRACHRPHQILARVKLLLAALHRTRMLNKPSNAGQSRGTRGLHLVRFMADCCTHTNRQTLTKQLFDNNYLRMFRQYG
jgi:hypothetical protein